MSAAADALMGIFGFKRVVGEMSKSVEEVRRAAFEAWALDKWPGAPVRAVRDSLPVDDPCYGDYVDVDLYFAWLGFNAALNAVAIELPDDGREDCEKDWGSKCRNDFDTGYNYASMKHEKAIEQAGLGIKVKP